MYYVVSKLLFKPSLFPASFFIWCPFSAKIVQKINIFSTTNHFYFLIKSCARGRNVHNFVPFFILGWILSIHVFFANNNLIFTSLVKHCVPLIFMCQTDTKEKGRMCNSIDWSGFENQTKFRAKSSIKKFFVSKKHSRKT